MPFPVLSVVCVSGSRDWKVVAPISQALTILSQFYGTTTLIHGAAPGADLIAFRAAKQLRFQHIQAYLANWRLYGKSAGPRRNREMLDQGKPDLVLACHDYLPASKGTADTVQAARARHIPVAIISSKMTYTEIEEAIAAAIGKETSSAVVNSDQTGDSTGDLPNPNHDPVALDRSIY